MSLRYISQLSQSTTFFFSPFTRFPSTVSVAEAKMVRAALVTATSLALTGAVVAHAYLLKHQFYPTVVYLTKSSPSMAVRAVLKWSPVLHWYFFKSRISDNMRNQLLVSVLFRVSGVVHSGLCVGVLAGKVHEEGLFWTAKGCRNGGSVLFKYLWLPWLIITHI